MIGARRDPIVTTGLRGGSSQDTPQKEAPFRPPGFREHASWALASDTLEFIDLEGTPVSPGCRYRGSDSIGDPVRVWLQPLGPLSAKLTSRV
jgi:uncharacterized protein